MRGRGTGVVGYRRARGVRAGPALALAAGVAALAGAAHAEDGAAATPLSSVTVTAADRPLEHDTGLAVLPTTVQDTPQVVNVIPNAQLEAQGVVSLEQALRNVPGITIAIGEGGTLSGDQFKIRGFDAKDDVYIDGLRDFGAYTRDSFDYDEVQVLKGPSGAMFGRGDVGGAINIITKAPKLEDFADVEAYAGTGSFYRALADVNHRIGDTAAVRLDLMDNDTGVVDRDLVYSRRWGAALAAGFGLGTSTEVELSWIHQHDHQRPDYGIDIVQRPGDIVALPATEYDVGVGRSSFLGFREDLDRSDADLFTVSVRHDVSDRVKLTSDTRYGLYSRYFQYTSQDQCNAACTTALFDNNPATEPYGGIGGGGPYDMDAWGLQNVSTLRYDGPVGRWRTEAIVGVDLSRQVNDKLFYAYTLPPGVTVRTNLLHPIVHTDPTYPPGYTVFRAIPGQNITCPATGNCTTDVLGSTVYSSVAGTGALSTHGESTDLGVFLTDRLWLTEALSLVGSVRLDRYDAQLGTLTYANAYSNLKVNSDLTSPRASLVFEPAKDQTYYLSWGRSQTPQGTSIVGAGTAIAVTTQDLQPEDGEIVEAGAKLRIPGTRVSASASVFDINKSNALQTDPDTGFLQAQSGEKQEVRGVELGLTGKITRAWTVNAAYSYLDARIKQSFTNCSAATTTVGAPTAVICPAGVPASTPVLNTVAVGRQVTFVPKNSASLFTSYDFTGPLGGLSVGGDVIYQSRMYLGYTARSVSYADPAALTASKIAEVPDSVTLDAFAAYRIGRYRLAVNVYNLTDRLNYTQVFGNRAVPAAGRTVVFSIGASF